MFMVQGTSQQKQIVKPKFFAFILLEKEIRKVYYHYEQRVQNIRRLI